MKVGDRVKVTMIATVTACPVPGYSGKATGINVQSCSDDFNHFFMSEDSAVFEVLPDPIMVGDKVRLKKQFELFHPYVVREVLGIHGKSAWVTSNGEWFPDGTLVPLDLLVRC